MHQTTVMNWLPSLRAGVFILAALLGGTATFAAPTAPEDFTFIQVSDVHAPMAQSARTISRVKGLGEINMTPFNSKALAPSFVIATGDLTEFGGGNGWWEDYMSYWNGISIPVYHQLGNHDNTWHANIDFLRKKGQKPPFSFDAHGCHFVGLMTPTPQDPRPSVSEEQLLWLEKDLEKVGKQTPVFAFFHHPLGGSEFASRYDWERLLDVLRPYNTVLMLAGHSHGFVHKKVQGMDQVTGGSTFGPNAGFSVISVKDDVLRVAYWKASEEAPGARLLEKRLPAKASAPLIEISSPALRDVCKSNLNIYVRLDKRPAGKALFTIDDQLSGELILSGSEGAFKAVGRADLSTLVPGAHYLRVEFPDAGEAFTKSTHFFYEPGESKLAWRSYLGASSKVTPAIGNGIVAVGANDGVLRVFDSATGRQRWMAATDAEILGSPLISDGNVIAANGSGAVSAFDAAGQKLWTFHAGDSVYSAPVRSGANVVFGCNNGVLYAVDAISGKLAWTNADAGYVIESTPCVMNDKIFFGAWDQYIRCVDANSGKLLWKSTTEGVKKAKAAQRYYSPGDAPPVVVGNKVFVADRAYMLTVLDASTGDQLATIEKVAAVGKAQDEKHVYLRRLDGRLTKVNSDEKEIWNVDAGLNAIPVPPCESNGKVYVCGATGLLSVVSSENGEILARYSASPKLFVMSGISADGQHAYLTSFDGSLTALKVQ